MDGSLPKTRVRPDRLYISISYPVHHFAILQLYRCLFSIYSDRGVKACNKYSVLLAMNTRISDFIHLQVDQEEHARRDGRQETVGHEGWGYSCLENTHGRYTGRNELGRDKHDGRDRLTIRLPCYGSTDEDRLAENMCIYAASDGGGRKTVWEVRSSELVGVEGC
jgi:hypothetical protein